MIDISRLRNVRMHGGRIIAQCPACAEAGRDSKGNHLSICGEDGTGAFNCITCSGLEGRDHRRRVFALVGKRDHHSKSSCSTSFGAGPLTMPKDRLQGVRVKTPPSRYAWSAVQARMEGGRVADLASLARLRRLPLFAGLELMRQAGMLHFVDQPHDGRCWVITDASRRVGQLRRLDGGLMTGIGAKAKTLVSVDGGATWPVGVDAIGDRKGVLLVEGGPDFPAAWTALYLCGMLDHFAPVVLFGAGMRIHPEAIPSFMGKRVLIVEHRDKAGECAGRSWFGQLKETAHRVRGIRFDEGDVGAGKDLNDLVAKVDPESGNLPAAFVETLNSLLK